MTSTFTLKSVVVEEAPAWVECTQCEGTTQIKNENPRGGQTVFIQCQACNGDGGKWHEAVMENPYTRDTFVNMVFVTKSTILEREWGFCSECEGHKGCYGSDSEGMTDIWEPCSHCHKDEQGNSTGCEPGTQGEWEVADD